MEEFKRAYFKMLAYSKIKEIVPKAIYNRVNKTFDLHLYITMSDEINIGLGGNISSHQANQLYLGLGYRYLLGSVRRGAAIVALCIEGKQISSEELAQFLADRANSGAGDVAFVIGSSHGLSDEVKRAAALRFSMGRITMPHQLARLVLTEQIYRACTINAGMKYHK